MEEKPEQNAAEEDLSVLMSRARALSKELHVLRRRIAKAVSSDENSKVYFPISDAEQGVNIDSDDDDDDTGNSQFREDEELLPVSSPVSSDGEASSSPLPSIFLPALSLQDPLRLKWRLGMGLPTVSRIPDDVNSKSVSAQALKVPDGYLRLFGLLATGEPWQCKIPFEQIAQEGGVTIGRDPAVSQVVLSENGVSRAHALLEINERGLVITDAGSTNGVVLNERPLGRYERQVSLRDGMTLNLGEINLRVEII